MPRYFSLISASLSRCSVVRIAPEFLAHTLMQVPRRTPGQTVRQPEHNGVVAIAGLLERHRSLVATEVGGDGEEPEVVGMATIFGAMKSASAKLGRFFTSCWRRV